MALTGDHDRGLRCFIMGPVVLVTSFFVQGILSLETPAKDIVLDKEIPRQARAVVDPTSDVLKTTTADRQPHHRLLNGFG